MCEAAAALLWPVAQGAGGGGGGGGLALLAPEQLGRLAWAFATYNYFPPDEWVQVSRGHTHTYSRHTCTDAHTQTHTHTLSNAVLCEMFFLVLVNTKQTHTHAQTHTHTRTHIQYTHTHAPCTQAYWLDGIWRRDVSPGGACSVLWSLGAMQLPAEGLWLKHYFLTVRRT